MADDDPRGFLMPGLVKVFHMDALDEARAWVVD